MTFEVNRVKFTFDWDQEDFQIFEVNAKLTDRHISQIIRPILKEKIPMLKKENEKLMAEKQR